MNDIQCWATTNDSYGRNKDQSFKQLIIEKWPVKDLTMLIKEVNAKAGMENIEYEDIIVPHGLRERKINAEAKNT